MADNYDATQGSGTTFGADDVSGVLYPRVKLQIGADGERADVDGGQQAMANSVPVVIASDQDFVKAEDAAHSSGDKGIPALAVRKDTAAALAGTDGDYTPLESDASGRLHALAHSGATDDAAAAGQLYPAAGLYQATADEVDDGDVGRIRMSKRRSGLWAPDVRQLSITAAAPAPSGTDIVNLAAGAIVAADLEIRDTSSHYIVIPMASSGWRRIVMGVLTATQFDQAGSLKLYGCLDATALWSMLFSVTIPASTSVRAAIGAGGAVGQGGTAGGATMAYQAYWDVPALASCFPYIIVQMSFAVAPSAGEIQLSITRSTS